MLSLAEELMLLALHDEKGSVVFSASTALPYGLSGAVLLDLFFRKRLVLDGKNLRVIDSGGVDDPILEDALQLIRSDDRPRSLKHWIGRIHRNVEHLSQRVINSLVEKQILKREDKKVLWFFNVSRYPTLNAAPEMEIRNRIQNIVLYDQPPEEREIALLSLVKACELVGEVFGGQRKVAKKKIQDLTKDEHIGQVISAVVAEMMAAIMVAVTAATVATTVATTS